mmetsp:Transcript_28076/g.86978  ORF Transcript_28076/g.86978 Transcript_28076/m.86978 type:complete len:314 (-) Transcript_28076:1845-2786(-)
MPAALLRRAPWTPATWRFMCWYLQQKTKSEMVTMNPSTDTAMTAGFFAAVLAAMKESGRVDALGTTVVLSIHVMVTSASGRKPTFSVHVPNCTTPLRCWICSVKAAFERSPLAPRRTVPVRPLRRFTARIISTTRVPLLKMERAGLAGSLSLPPLPSTIRAMVSMTTLAASWAKGEYMSEYCSEQRSLSKPPAESSCIASAVSGGTRGSALYCGSTQMLPMSGRRTSGRSAVYWQMVSVKRKRCDCCIPRLATPAKKLASCSSLAGRATTTMRVMSCSRMSSSAAAMDALVLSCGSSMYDFSTPVAWSLSAVV